MLPSIKNRSPFGLVLMPFAGKFKNQWDHAFYPAIKRAGFEPYRADAEHLGTGIIRRDITRMIWEAEIIVAELTGTNANVMYELGLAHAAKKPVVIVVQDEKDIPFDVQQMRFLVYNSDDLKELQENLTQRIQSTLAMDADVRPDLFPELKIMGDDEARELEYFRQGSARLRITTAPDTAEIFFNSRLIGPGPQDIRINPYADKNVLAVTAPEHLEKYYDLSREEIESALERGGRFPIELEKGGVADEPLERMANWLKLRRRDPDNPVLMKAIAQFLKAKGELDDALDEAQDLLAAMPSWPVAHGTIGSVYKRIALEYIQQGDTAKAEQSYAKALEHFNIALELKTDYISSFIAISCIHSLRGDFEQTIASLQPLKSESRQDLLRTYSLLGKWTFLKDSDFHPILEDPDYGPKFRQLVAEIDERKAQLLAKGDA